MMPSRLPGRTSASSSSTSESRRRRRRKPFESAAPIVESIAVCRLVAAAGLRPRVAIGVVAEASPDPDGELNRAASALDAGLPLVEALSPERAEFDPELGRLFRILIAADTSGLDYSAELDSLLDSIRRDRLTQLEVGVGRLSVAMQFPIVLCILPAFVLLAIAPLVATTASQLGL